MPPAQFTLFEPAPSLPEGFAYRPRLLPDEDERGLARRLADLPFAAFEFQGYLGLRRVVSFGWRYDFNQRELRRSEDIPSFLLALRAKAADFAGIPASELQQVLVTEYAAGAGIGWHRDKPMFVEVVGVSFAAPCRFRLRRKAGAGWERASLILEPGSAYHLKGASRSEWEHSIPPLDALRYSVTFRTFKAG